MALTITFRTKLLKMIKKMALRDNVSKPEVIRKALAIYNYLYDEVIDGNKVIVVDKNGELIKDINFN